MEVDIIDKNTILHQTIVTQSQGGDSLNYVRSMIS